jgi:predicted DNA-binding ribbon-helix-helix protein
MSNYRPKKRSITVNGHRTSVSLEDPFWNYFYKLAMEKNISINVLASDIDLKRQSDGGLATSIRIFCLNEAIKR